MKKIYGYNTDIKNVVGIQQINVEYHNTNIYYNNREFTRERERKQRREEKKIENSLRNQEKKKMQGTESQKTTFKSNDANIIYMMEYARVRNRRIYNQLNPGENAIIVDYRSKREPMRRREMANAYSTTARNASIIDFQTRAQDVANKRKQTTNSKDKVGTGTKTVKGTTTQTQPVKKVMSKEEEMAQFKAYLKQFPQPKTEMEKAISSFEKALKEKNEYNEELRRNGYREIKGGREITRGNTNNRSTSSRNADNRRTGTVYTSKKTTIKDISTKSRKKNTVKRKPKKKKVIRKKNTKRRNTGRER